MTDHLSLAFDVCGIIWATTSQHALRFRKAISAAGE